MTFLQHNFFLHFSIHFFILASNRQYDVKKKEQPEMSMSKYYTRTKSVYIIGLLNVKLSDRSFTVL